YSPAALTSTTYYRQVQSSMGGCGSLNTNVLNISINSNLPVSVSIEVSNNPVCSGTSVIFSATPTGGGTAPMYQWKVNGSSISGATNNTYSFVPINADAITCLLTSNATCATGSPATSNTVAMTVNPNLPVSVSVTPSNNPVCSGTSVAFTATPTNGGPIPLYQWDINGTDILGATCASYTYTSINNDVVTCILTSSATCAIGSPATSNPVSMIVNPNLPVSVLIVPSVNPCCAGTLVTFSAIPVNGGLTPVYQWKVNGTIISGTTNSSYAYVPSNDDAITCLMTSDATCSTGSPATSNTVTMTVNPNQPVSVSISPSNNPVCSGTSVTFTATPTGGGTTPTYQWKVNGTSITGATNSSYTFIPLDMDEINCVLTSSAICAINPASSNTVTMTVNPNQAVSLSISPSGNPVCVGTSVTFSAIATGGGTTPIYQWKVNGSNVPGATNNIYSYVPANMDVITCLLTSNANCATGNPATSNTVTMTVNPNLPVSVSISPSVNPTCSGTSVTFSAIPANGGTNPTYQWKVNGSSITGATNSSCSYVPLNSDAITCLLTSNAICAEGNPASSNTVTMTINPNLPVSVSISPSNNPVCSGASVTFSATPANGGTTPTYQWKVNAANVPGATNSTYDYVPLNADAIHCLLTSNAVCAVGSPATSNTLSMTVSPNLPVSLSISSSANPVCAGTLTTFSATPANGGTTPTYQWKVNGSSISGATNITYSYVPSNTDAITCLFTSNATCATGNPATSNIVTMTVNPNLPVSVSILPSINPVCQGTLVTFTATPANGGINATYQWMVNGSNITGASNSTYSYVPLADDEIICILASNAPCVTGSPAWSNTVTMMVNPNVPVSLSIAASANPVPNGTTVTFTATPTNGGITPLYQWMVNSMNVGSGNVTFSYIPSQGDSIKCRLLSSNLTCVTGNPAISNTVVMTVNGINSTITLSGTLTGTECYNATQTINVAGSGTVFIVQPGGNATMIAGLNIHYFPGTRVESGGYMLGKISPGGPYCGELTPSIATVVTGEDDPALISKKVFFKIYPNPTTGIFTLELNGFDKSQTACIEIYGMRGEKIQRKEISVEQKQKFSLSDEPVGIYFIRVISGNRSETTKIIRNQ
ncbi:MAG: T9SS type A sorting domain-containing protein, partial [Bacteroidota bacterium]